MPTAGPTASDIVHQETRGGRYRFDLVDIDARVVAVLLAETKPSFRSRFASGPPPELRMNVGDSVSVSIWEMSGGGLFGTATAGAGAGGAHSVALPKQVIGRDGAISVPYAGRISAAGRLPLEVQRAIERRLTGKAIDPQAIVTVVESPANSVTVNGETVAGARVALSPRGERLLDVIAAAGGVKSPVYETAIQLSRDGVTATIPMDVLVEQPAENIFVRPGDVLTVLHRPRTFTVFGASGTNSQINFPGKTLTLVEALAKAGGLQDARSDPAGVFLLRDEPAAVVSALGRPQLSTGRDGTTPVVYRLDLSDASAYFRAQRFAVEDKDILYVANADIDELQKFFQLLSTLTSPVVTGIVVRNATQ